MFKRQTTGSVVCVSCGYLVGVNDDVCYHCGRRNPGLWGFAPALRRLGTRPRLRAVRHGHVHRHVRAVAAAVGQRTSWRRRPVGLPRARSAAACSLLRRERRHAGVRSTAAGGRCSAPSWLHGGAAAHPLQHDVGAAARARRRPSSTGPGRMVIIYTVAGVVGFLLTSVAGVYLCVPAVPAAARSSRSARRRPIFGLLGALVHYGRRTGSQRRPLAGAVLCRRCSSSSGSSCGASTTTRTPAAFVGGYLASRVLDPLKPERINHLVDRARVPRGVDSLDHRVGHSRVGHCGERCGETSRPHHRRGGEIGHGLIERLAADDQRAASSRSTSPRSRPASGGRCSARSPARSSTTRVLERILAEFEVDLIFHLAALLSTRSEFTPVTAHQVNVEGTLNLLEFAQHEAESHGRPVTFLYPSSIAAYGLPRSRRKPAAGRVREDDWAHADDDVRVQQAVLRAAGALLRAVLQAARRPSRRAGASISAPCGFPG